LYELILLLSGSETVIAPFKKPNGAELSQRQLDYNTIHAWFRTGIEHCFSQVKKFRVLGDEYRGKVSQSTLRISNIFNIVMGIVALQTRHRPLRRHLPLLDAAEEADARAEGRAAREALHGAPRDRRFGFDVGDPALDLIVRDGRTVGRGAEPDPIALHVSSHRIAEDFAVGDRVWVWWWGRVWRARVQYISTRHNHLTIRWAHNHHSTVPRYRPDLVWPDG
jgi:hypothetical protein